MTEHKSAEPAAAAHPAHPAIPVHPAVPAAAHPAPKPMVWVKATARGYDCVSAMRELGDLFQMPKGSRGSWFRLATDAELSTEQREVNKAAAETAAEAKADSAAEDLSNKAETDAAKEVAAKADALANPTYTPAPPAPAPTLQPTPLPDQREILRAKQSAPAVKK